METVAVGGGSVDGGAVMQESGADGGNRTHASGLENRRSTVELHPRADQPNSLCVNKRLMRSQKFPAFPDEANTF